MCDWSHSKSWVGTAFVVWQLTFIEFPLSAFYWKMLESACTDSNTAHLNLCMEKVMLWAKPKNMLPAAWNHQTKWGLLEQSGRGVGGAHSPGAPVGEVFPWESRLLCLSRVPTIGTVRVTLISQRQHKPSAAALKFKKCLWGHFIRWKLEMTKLVPGGGGRERERENCAHRNN